MKPTDKFSDLTVRDRIAVEAMKALLSVDDLSMEFALLHAYEYADALIAESQKGTTQQPERDGA